MKDSRWIRKKWINLTLHYFIPMRKDLKFITKPLRYFNDSRISWEDSIQIAEENLLLRTSWNKVDKSWTAELYKYDIEWNNVTVKCITYERYIGKESFEDWKDCFDKCIRNWELHKKWHNIERKAHFRKLIRWIFVWEIDEGRSVITWVKVNAFILFHILWRESAIKYINKKLNILNKKTVIGKENLDDIRELIETGYIKEKQNH